MLFGKSGLMINKCLTLAPWLCKGRESPPSVWSLLQEVVTRCLNGINLQLWVLVKGCKSPWSLELLAACTPTEGARFNLLSLFFFFCPASDNNSREADRTTSVYLCFALKDKVVTNIPDTWAQTAVQNDLKRNVNKTQRDKQTGNKEQTHPNISVFDYNIVNTRVCIFSQQTPKIKNKWIDCFCFNIMRTAW